MAASQNAEVDSVRRIDGFPDVPRNSSRLDDLKLCEPDAFIISRDGRELDAKARVYH